MTSVKIDGDVLLPKCPEVGTSLSLPGPLNERLDQLLALANEAGAATSRRELIAALILAASDDADALFQLVVSFRRTRAADAVVRGRPVAEVLEFRRHRRGPRPRSA